MEKLFYKGTIVKVKSITFDDIEPYDYMLVESINSEYVFQFVCISGYSSGHVIGYIYYDKSPLCKGHIAVTESHLINEVRRNLGEIDIDYFNILEKSN